MCELCDQLRVNIKTLIVNTVAKAESLLLAQNTVSFAASIPLLGVEIALGQGYPKGRKETRSLTEFTEKLA